MRGSDRRVALKSWEASVGFRQDGGRFCLKEGKCCARLAVFCFWFLRDAFVLVWHFVVNVVDEDLNVVSGSGSLVNALTC